MKDKNQEILVVEDCNSLRNVMVAGLSKFNQVKCRVDGAINGREGLIMAQEISYDLIIADMIMPEKCGAELVRELRKVESHKKTPIIFMSGFFHVTPFQKYEDIIDQDALIVIDKPFSMDKFRRAVSAALSSNPTAKFW